MFRDLRVPYSLWVKLKIESQRVDRTSLQTSSRHSLKASRSWTLQIECWFTCVFVLLAGRQLARTKPVRTKHGVGRFVVLWSSRYLCTWMTNVTLQCIWEACKSLTNRRTTFLRVLLAFEARGGHVSCSFRSPVTKPALSTTHAIIQCIWHAFEDF